MDDASDRRQIRKAEREAKAAAERLRTTLAWIMSTRQGREWVYTQLEACHIGASSFAPDPYIHAFRSGEQNIGIQLWSSLQIACPDLYIMMLGEAHERSIVDDNRHGRDHAGRNGDDPSARVDSEYDPNAGGPDNASDDDRRYEDK